MKRPALLLTGALVALASALAMELFFSWSPDGSAALTGQPAEPFVNAGFPQDMGAETGAAEALLALFIQGGQGEAPGRPDDVSMLEWQVISGVAAEAADPEHKQAQLLAKLRFHRQLEAFREQQDVSLGEELLRQIPDQVASESLSSNRAQQLQSEILQVLEPDPEARRQRLHDEAQQIGVGFGFRAVSS